MFENVYGQDGWVYYETCQRQIRGASSRFVIVYLFAFAILYRRCVLNMMFNVLNWALGEYRLIKGIFHENFAQFNNLQDVLGTMGMFQISSTWWFNRFTLHWWLKRDDRARRGGSQGSRIEAVVKEELNQRVRRLQKKKSQEKAGYSTRSNFFGALARIVWIPKKPYVCHVESNFSKEP